MRRGLVDGRATAERLHKGVSIRAPPTAEADRAVFEFIEGFYNPRRRHSALDYLSPTEYEQTYAWAA